MADVLIDNKFTKLNAIRADRLAGLYLRNFTVQQPEFNSGLRAGDRRVRASTA